MARGAARRLVAVAARPSRPRSRRATASCGARSRRSILVVGLFSALLVIPQVRAVAGGLLASSAVLGVIIGLASQQTLGNFIAGILIAIDAAGPDRRPGQLRRRGRRRRGDRPHLHVHPHHRPPPARRPEQQARLRHRSSTPRSAAARRSPRFPCRFRSQPISTRRVDALREDVADERDASVYVSSLDGTATRDGTRGRRATRLAAERLEHELRLRAHGRLRALGVWT